MRIFAGIAGTTEDQRKLQGKSHFPLPQEPWGSIFMSDYKLDKGWLGKLQMMKMQEGGLSF